MCNKSGREARYFASALHSCFFFFFFFSLSGARIHTHTYTSTHIHRYLLCKYLYTLTDIREHLLLLLLLSLPDARAAVHSCPNRASFFHSYLYVRYIGDRVWIVLHCFVHFCFVTVVVSFRAIYKNDNRYIFICTCTATYIIVIPDTMGSKK